MVNSSNISKSTYHVRSISLPSRGHPSSSSVVNQLNRLRSSEAASSSSAFLVCQKLGGLKDLYDRIDDWLQLPQTQKDLSLDNEGILIEELLDGSLKLLDVCSNTRDFSLQMKDNIQELQSSLRRQKGVDEVVTSRKKINKAIAKYLENLKREQKSTTQSQGCNLESSIRMLKEAEEMCSDVFQALLCFLCGKGAKSKINGWSLFSKFLSVNRVSSKESKEDAKDVECLDRIVLLEIEEQLESIFRHLVKIRVSLLNILNH